VLERGRGANAEVKGDADRLSVSENRRFTLPGAMANIGWWGGVTVRTRGEKRGRRRKSGNVMAGDEDGDEDAVYAGEETNTVNKHLEGAAQLNGRTKEDEEDGRSMWRRRSPWRQLPRRYRSHDQAHISTHHRLAEMPSQTS
jgi:hypothetical protein